MKRGTAVVTRRELQVALTEQARGRL
jgi:hypothetical protein